MLTIWHWFIGLSLVGKAIAAIVTLYVVGYLVGSLGFGAAAKELGEAGALVLAVLLTGLFMRLIWQRYTSSFRR